VINILVELLRALVVGLILTYVVKEMKSIRKVSGSRCLIGGFSLLFFGTLIDITDNFPALNKFVIIGDTPVQSCLEGIVGYLFGFVFLAIGIRKWIPQIIKYQARLRGDLQKVKKEVKTLKGLLPICSSCKKIRNDEGYWDQLEAYITKNSEAIFSHGLCEDCARKLYPEIFKDSSDSAELE